MRKGKKKSFRDLTNKELLILICEIAYEQAYRELSGHTWYRDFVGKIYRKQTEQLKED